LKAAVYNEAGGPDVLTYVDIPAPECGPDEVLIAIEAISIEGGDLINRRLTPPARPMSVIGYAAAGTVTAVGAKVSNRAIGDRVTSFNLAGSHAELRSVSAGQTWRIPDGVDFSAATALPISHGTAHHCLFAKGGLQPGETVLIQAAAGGVGLAAVQLASRIGARVIAVASGKERLVRLKELGADHVVDRLQEEVLEVVKELTDGDGVALVIDPVGNTLQASLLALKPEGRLVFVGNAGGGELSIDLWPALQANQSLHGVFMGTQFAHADVYATVDTMLQAVADGEFDIVIDRVFPLADAAAAHEYAETGKPLGRVIMKPQARLAP